MIRRPPRSTLSSSSAASDVYKRQILIYGDYDVDGLTSVALLFSILKEFTTNLYYYIPNRFQEGYGLNEEAIDIAFKNNFKLIITVDCGISSICEIAVSYTHLRAHE